MERSANFYHVCQAMTISLIIMNSEHHPGEEITIGNDWNYKLSTDEQEARKEIIDEMNLDDWNGDSRQAQMELVNGNEITIDLRDPDDMTEDESSDEE